MFLRNTVEGDPGLPVLAPTPYQKLPVIGASEGVVLTAFDHADLLRAETLGHGRLGDISVVLTSVLGYSRLAEIVESSCIHKPVFRKRKTVVRAARYLFYPRHHQEVRGESRVARCTSP